MTLGDIFTPAELVAIAAIKQCFPSHLWAEKIDKDVVGPALARINEITGKENNSRFWAYIIIHVSR